MTIGTVMGSEDQTHSAPSPPCPPDIVCGGSGGGSPLSAWGSFKIFTNPRPPYPEAILLQGIIIMPFSEDYQALYVEAGSHYTMYQVTKKTRYDGA